MKDNYENLINEELITFFSSIYIIDIQSDKVYVFKDKIIDKELTFFDFMQQISPIIHPEDLNDYFDNLSISKLEYNNGSVSYKYRVKENDAFVEYINYAKLFILGNSKIVVSASIKNNEKEDSNDELELIKIKLNNIAFRISDVVLKIYNALDISNNENTREYIKVLLEQLIKEFPEFNYQMEKEMTSQVSRGKDTLMIIDDDIMTRNLIKKTFSDQYEIIMATNGKEALDIFENIGFNNIVGIFLDIMMPIMDGFAVLDYLQQKNILSKIPVITISGAEDKKTRQKVYQYNIADLLEKPFNLEIIKYRTKNLINLYRTSSSLNNMILSQHTDLFNIINGIVDSYIYDNKNRIERVRKYVEVLMKQVSNDYPEYQMLEYQINKIVKSVDLYNIGIYLLPRTLGKSGNLSKEEIELVKKHPIFASDIVKSYMLQFRDDELYKYSSNMILSCYENYDGSGYPYGLSKEQIPIYSQVLSLAIELDEIISKDKNIENEKILQLIKEKENKKYNPKIVATLPKVIDMIK